MYWKQACGSCVDCDIITDSVIMSAIGHRQQVTETENSVDACRQKYFSIVDNARNEMKRRFTENDVLNAVAAVDPNSQFLLSTEMPTVLAEKYSSTLNLDLEHLQSQAEVAKNAFLTGERPTTYFYDDDDDANKSTLS